MYVVSAGLLHSFKELAARVASCETRIEIDFSAFNPSIFPEYAEAVTVRAVGINATWDEAARTPGLVLRRRNNLVGDADVYLREVFDKPSPSNTLGYGAVCDSMLRTLSSY